LPEARSKTKAFSWWLDGVVDYLPAPTDIPPIPGINPDTEEPMVRHADDKEPFAALAFKVATDPFVGQIIFFRVYSGSLMSGSYVYNPRTRNKERIGRILRMHANRSRRSETSFRWRNCRRLSD